MADNLSARAKKAVEILKSGGQFRYALERDSYTGYSQFKASLVLKGHKVKGFGHSVFSDLRPFLVMAGGGTSVSTYYNLKEV